MVRRRGWRCNASDSVVGISMDEKVAQKIKQILVNDLFVEVPVERIDADAGLRSVYGLDSLGFVELRLKCDETFGVRIPDESFTADHFSSVRQLATLVMTLQGNGAAVAAPRMN